MLKSVLMSVLSICILGSEGQSGELQEVEDAREIHTRLFAKDLEENLKTVVERMKSNEAPGKLSVEIENVYQRVTFPVGFNAELKNSTLIAGDGAGAVRWVLIAGESPVHVVEFYLDQTLVMTESRAKIFRADIAKNATGDLPPPVMNHQAWSFVRGNRVVESFRVPRGFSSAIGGKWSDYQLSGRNWSLRLCLEQVLQRDGMVRQADLAPSGELVETQSESLDELPYCSIVAGKDLNYQVKIPVQEGEVIEWAKFAELVGANGRSYSQTSIVPLNREKKQNAYQVIINTPPDNGFYWLRVLGSCISKQFPNGQQICSNYCLVRVIKGRN